MKDTRILTTRLTGSAMLELREGRDGACGIIYKAGVASGSDDERPKLIERLMEVAREREIERLFLAPVGSDGDNLADDVEYRMCPYCEKYWVVAESDGLTDQICDACRPPSKGVE